MSDKKQDGIAVFDTLFTNNRICMLKVILPFLPPSLQKSIAIYIKYMELQYTLQYFLKHPHSLFIGQNTGENLSFNPDSMWDNLLPYCSPSEKQQVQQIRNMMQSFQSIKDMAEMLETMKELFPEGLNFGESCAFPKGSDFSGCSGSTDGFGFPGGFNFPGGFGFPEGFDILKDLVSTKSQDCSNHTNDSETAVRPNTSAPPDTTTVSTSSDSSNNGEVFSDKPSPELSDFFNTLIH